MRNAFLFTLSFALITLAIVSYFYCQERVYPHTYLGKINVSGLKKEQVIKLITSFYEEPVQIKVRNKMYTMQYKHIGVVLDQATTLRMIFENNNKPFPQNIPSYFQSLSSQNMILPTLVFSQDFLHFVDTSHFNFTQKEDEVMVDNTNKRLSLKDNEDLYRINDEHFQSLLLFQYGNKKAVLEPQLVQIIHTDKQDKINAKNNKLIDVFSAPIDIVIQDSGKLISTFISSNELKRIYDVSYVNGEVVYTPHEDVLFSLIDNKVDPLINRDKKVDIKTLGTNVLSAFTSRVQGKQSGPLLTSTVLSPLKEVEQTSTHGEIASRYIEINISKQKMYLWDQGQMIKSFTVSTGLYYPTPAGHFHIMNKAPEGYSDIFNVYMPWWMAFYYGWAGGQDAYFGIHELPYWYVGQDRKQRPREFLGSPHTGGCVSLDIGAAKEVYDFSYVGMDVVVFN